MDWSFPLGSHPGGDATPKRPHAACGQRDRQPGRLPAQAKAPVLPGQKMARQPKLGLPSLPLPWVEWCFPGDPHPAQAPPSPTPVGEGNACIVCLRLGSFGFVFTCYSGCKSRVLTAPLLGFSHFARWVRSAKNTHFHAGLFRHLDGQRRRRSFWKWPGLAAFLGQWT